MSIRKNADETYYASSIAETTEAAPKTVIYKTEENKVITGDYSFDLLEGYKVKDNEKYISA